MGAFGATGRLRLLDLHRLHYRQQMGNRPQAYPLIVPSTRLDWSHRARMGRCASDEASVGGC